MPILWMMLSHEMKRLLERIQLERYGEKLDYPRNHRDITVEPAIEPTQEVEILMQQTKKSWKGE